jgi:acylglycerol lipase
VFVAPPEIQFYECADGRRLAVRVWRAENPSADNVVMLHGITSHGGWYARSCAHLAAAGYNVHFLDRRGSGLNAEQPGDIDKWQTWVDDVAQYLRKLQNSDAAPNSPPTTLPPARRLFLCGISWGGKLATAIARQHPGLLSAVALICPGLYSHFEPRCCTRLLLTMPVPYRVASATVPIPLRQPELFIDNPHWQRFVETDPLSLRRITWRFAREDRKLNRFSRNAATYLHMPLLLILAGRDRIVDNRRTRAYFGRTASGRKTLLEYRDATHTLEFENEPDEYFADLTAWIANVCGQSSGSDRTDRC